jgi:hypothetical protein
MSVRCGQAAGFAVCAAGATAAVVLAGAGAGAAGLAGANPVGCGGNGVRVIAIFLLAFQSACGLVTRKTFKERELA